MLNEFNFDSFQSNMNATLIAKCTGEIDLDIKYRSITPIENIFDTINV
jgi:hypothetical protein